MSILIERARSLFRRPEPTSYSLTKVEPFGSSERRDAYLRSLDSVTRKNIEDFVHFLRTSQSVGTRIGLIAVGNSTKPEGRISDVDLKVLNSIGAYYEHPEGRQDKAAELRRRTEEHLNRRKIKFRRERSAEIARRGGYDRSIRTMPEDGSLPLHVFFSGKDEPHLRRYLELERLRKTSAVVLL